MDDAVADIVVDARQNRPVNLPSLLVGLLSLAAAALYLLDSSGAVRVDEAVALATLWIVVGAVALVRSVRRLVTRRPG